MGARVACNMHRANEKIQEQNVLKERPIPSPQSLSIMFFLGSRVTGSRVSVSRVPTLCEPGIGREMLGIRIFYQFNIMHTT